MVIIKLLPAKKLAFVLLGSIQHYRQVRLITEVFSEDMPHAFLWYYCGTKWP